jgi:hypothetical protein
MGLLLSGTTQQSGWTARSTIQVRIEGSSVAASRGG